MLLKVVSTNSFEKHYRDRVIKRNRNTALYEETVAKLASGQKLDPSCKDHRLIGKWKGYRSCHVEPDLCLIYRIDPKRKILVLVETGSHSDLY